MLKTRIFTLAFCIMLCLMSITFVQATKKEITIQIAGCSDGSLCNACALSTYGWCDCSGAYSIVKDCRGPSLDMQCASSCNTAGGYYCSSEDGSCVLEGIGDCLGGNWEDCIANPGCYFDSSTSSCTSCEPPGDKLCSEYISEESCTFDICGYGTNGPDSAICYASGIQNCGCHWENDKCELSFEERDADGNPVFCHFEQSSTECSADTNEATLTTTKICINEVTGEETSEESEPRPIPCGKAVSPLPFISLFGIMGVAFILICYYFFFFRKN